MIIYKAGELDAQRAFDMACGRILSFGRAMRSKYGTETHAQWWRRADDYDKAFFRKLQAERRVAESMIERYRRPNRPGFEKGSRKKKKE